MKIAIPATANNIDSEVCPSFGRTEFFFIYNTNDQSKFFLDNSAATSQGGAGIKAAQILVDEHVDVLITPRCGENAASVLLEANIAIYKAAGNNLKDNISACEQGKLEMLNEIHPGLHNHGGK
ncbi:NifB/NifX family molybdenum-iron cluster-binding protein [Succinispira mobilis]|uniref:NifB/NifX family molybdenum-iron cluster-binding protein n=1 Tax=Succinispira mobilis TaxID=78120 RepID=UPI000373413E|nr:NifB/NifX family molybdenum-iron cluster-binding protein [Succinispira mobilis]